MHHKEEGEHKPQDLEKGFAVWLRVHISDDDTYSSNSEQFEHTEHGEEFTSIASNFIEGYTGEDIQEEPATLYVSFSNKVWAIYLIPRLNWDKCSSQVDKDIAKEG